MWSSEVRIAIATGLVVMAWTGAADAQPAPPQGFAVDRLYLSAPGAGWTVMDTLDMHGGLGGVISLTTSYAHDPFRVRSADGRQRLAVVSDEALADFGFAATYDRFRLYLNFDMPIYLTGQSGMVGGTYFASPSSGQPFTPGPVDLGSAPDAFEDARVGFDARIVGDERSRFRLGAGAQLYVPSPNDNGSEYISDGTFRAMGRLLFAGDVGAFGYAGQVGVHVRPLDQTSTAGPQGSELLFGVAAGPRFAVGADRALVVGPEVFGETAFKSFLGTTGTGVEGLLSARLEGTGHDGGQLRFKAGIGAGLDPRFGAPEWRALVGVELFDHHRDADGDGVSDAKDACPDAAGVGRSDANARGCP